MMIRGWGLFLSPTGLVFICDKIHWENTKFYQWLKVYRLSWQRLHYGELYHYFFQLLFFKICYAWMWKGILTHRAMTTPPPPNEMEQPWVKKGIKCGHGLVHNCTEFSLTLFNSSFTPTPTVYSTHVVGNKIQLYIIFNLKFLKQCNLLAKKIRIFYFNQAFPTQFFCIWFAHLVTRNEIMTKIWNTSSDFRACELGTSRRYGSLYIFIFIHSTNFFYNKLCRT